MGTRTPSLKVRSLTRYPIALYGRIYNYYLYICPPTPYLLLYTCLSSYLPLYLFVLLFALYAPILVCPPICPLCLLPFALYACCPLPSILVALYTCFAHILIFYNFNFLRLDCIHASFGTSSSGHIIYIIILYIVY